MQRTVTKIHKTNSSSGIQQKTAKRLSADFGNQQSQKQLQRADQQNTLAKKLSLAPTECTQNTSKGSQPLLRTTLVRTLQKDTTTNPFLSIGSFQARISKVQIVTTTGTQEIIKSQKFIKSKINSGIKKRDGISEILKNLLLKKKEQIVNNQESSRTNDSENKLNDIEQVQMELNKNGQVLLNSQQNKQDDNQNNQLNDQDYDLQQEFIYIEASQEDDKDNALDNSQHEDRERALFEQNYQSESKQLQNIQLSTCDNVQGKCLIQEKIKAKCN